MNRASNFDSTWNKLNGNPTRLEGVELVACHMAVEMMEIEEDQLIEKVPVWTAEDFMKYARDCKICLFT